MSRLSKPKRSATGSSAHSTAPSIDAAPLSPPRPFFFAQDARRDSGSDSSISDSDRENTAPRVQTHARRRSAIAASTYAPVAAASPVSPSFPGRRRNSNPFDGSTAGYAYAQQDRDYAPVSGAGLEDSELSPAVANTWSAANLYYNDVDEPASPPASRGRVSSGQARPPPSSFQFPFQSHPGNPDPIPRRRSGSFESLTSGGDHRFQATSSDASHEPSLPQPVAPFMAGGDPRHSSSSGSISAMNTNSIYRTSAAAGMLQPSASQTALNAAYTANQAGNSTQDLGGPPVAPFAAIPRSPSQTFRAPFLSPASRPGSSLWSPPSYPSYPSFPGPGSGSGSAVQLALPAPPAPAPSTRLAEKLTKEEKPWLQRSAPRARVSWWLTAVCMLLGLLGAAALVFFGYEGVNRFTDSQLCSVLDDNFDTFDLQNTWTREVQLGGFGNAEFQIASNFDNNSRVMNGELYIMPTLTSAWLGESTVQSGSITVPDCTEAKTNITACKASGNGVDQVINPVMSARISTKNHFSITYGRVEVRAKLPRGDWLWPAIWMLPVTGTWPLSGELDIMEARGNGPDYPAQGTNFVRSTVQYGPLASVVKILFGWYGLKRNSFDKGFHTYGLEWDDKWMRFYTDTRVHTMLEISTKNSKSSFWNRAGFPATAQNGSAEIPLKNPYQHNNSPFDQPFYLIIDLAVGGTSGWFPDKVGGKPWFDGSLNAMYEFYKAQDTWHKTWPTDPADGAFRIDSVKMWKKC